MTFDRHASTNELTCTVRPLIPQIIESYLKIGILKTMVSNDVRFGFQFFLDELDQKSVYMCDFLVDRNTSLVSDASIIPSLSSSICSWIALIARRPSRSLSGSVHRWNVPVHSKSTILVCSWNAHGGFGRISTWIGYIVGNVVLMIAQVTRDDQIQQ